MLLDKIKARIYNRYFIAGTVAWVAGVAYALSLGLKMLIPLALIFIGDFLYSLSKGE